LKIPKDLKNFQI